MAKWDICKCQYNRSIDPSEIRPMSGLIYLICKIIVFDFAGILPNRCAPLLFFLKPPSSTYLFNYVVVQFLAVAIYLPFRLTFIIWCLLLLLLLLYYLACRCVLSILFCSMQRMQTDFTQRVKLSLERRMDGFEPWRRKCECLIGKINIWNIYLYMFKERNHKALWFPHSIGSALWNHSPVQNNTDNGIFVFIFW